MSRGRSTAEGRRGGALALPLLLCSLASVMAVNPAWADSVVTAQAEAPHVDGGVRQILAKPEALDGLSKALVGYPSTGASFTLYGGGATFAPGDVRVGVSAWTGGLQASNGSKMTSWGLSMASLNLEQRYLQGSFLITGGTGVDYGQFHGGLDDAATAHLNRIESQLWGYSATAGMRWPAHSRLAFFMRTGYQWLQGDGVWHGPDAKGGEHLNLSGPNLTAQVELSFQ